MSEKGVYSFAIQVLVRADGPQDANDTAHELTVPLLDDEAVLDATRSPAVAWAPFENARKA